MKTIEAEIKTYRTNAILFVGEEDIYRIDWDGYEFITPQEYYEWIDEVLEPANGCKNYDHVRTMLEISTDYLRPDESKRYSVCYEPDPSGYNSRYVGSVSDYCDGGYVDPILMSKEQAEELLSELDNYVRNEEDFDGCREEALYRYEKNEWGFVIMDEWAVI